MNDDNVIRFADGCRLVLEADLDPESPRKWDNLSQMVFFHRRHSLGDEHDYTPDDFDSWRQLQQKILRDHDVAVCAPVFMYDHSGLSFSFSNSGYPFNDRWDAGQLGFMFVTKQRAREHYGVKRITDKVRQRIRRSMWGELQTYSQYVNGDVWGFVLEDAEGDEIDSCWGFFGSNPRENGMRDHLDEKYHAEIDARFPAPYSPDDVSRCYV